MTITERRKKTRAFTRKWNRMPGKENQDDRTYWIDFLNDVMGIDNVTDMIEFQKDAIIDDHIKHIDAYIPKTKVLIEQKSKDKPLDKKYPQSDGSMKTPYEQADRYNNGLKHAEKARWIITSNFQEIWIYDMNLEVREREPIKVNIDDLEHKLDYFDFLLDDTVEEVRDEVKVSKEAGAIVGEIYDAFLKEYGNNPSEEDLKELNKLCVRIVFCLYAEDSNLFDSQAFCNYLDKFPTDEINGALKRLFEVLDTPEDKRDRFLSGDLSSFPYVNGQLFNGSISIPPITDEIKDLLINKASRHFDWSQISPTIFGAVFESTLNPETRRKGGMHYTSIENIHKVIDPLFLDNLKQEFEKIFTFKQAKVRIEKLKEFQNKLARLKFLDPASGSGNFLTETFICIRKLENRVIEELLSERNKTTGQIAIGVDDESEGKFIKVSIQQFYGIEINDFAVAVSKTALWIAESQMIKETEDIIFQSIEFFPLKTNAYIHEANALRIDWNDVLPASECNYIMGNPPFVGASMMTDKQKYEVVSIIGKIKLANSVDYVCGWYYLAAKYIEHSNIRVAFVSTNSITQGEQVEPVWGNLFRRYNISINFAYRTFIWDSEASIKAHVHCVIVGFSNTLFNSTKKIYDGSNEYICDNINGYLLDAPSISVCSRGKPLCGVPKLTKGNQPTDNGNFILSEDEANELIKNDKKALSYVKRYVGARDYLNNNEKRFCLWLKDVEPQLYSHNKCVMNRLNNIREFRGKSSAAPTRKSSEKPYLFFSTPQTSETYLIIPRVSSERRRYIPIGFMSPDVIAADSCSIICGANIFHFGILESNVHMAWMRAVAGRLKSDYRYSAGIVYNNFPWCNPTPEQKEKIEKTAQGILDARELYPDSSLADLYDPLTMPPELQKAHRENDKAVMQAYGFDLRMTESDCVAELMKMYQKLTEGE